MYGLFLMPGWLTNLCSMPPAPFSLRAVGLNDITFACLFSTEYWNFNGGGARRGGIGITWLFLFFNLEPFANSNSFLDKFIFYFLFSPELSSDCPRPFWGCYYCLWLSLNVLLVGLLGLFLGLSANVKLSLTFSFRYVSNLCENRLRDLFDFLSMSNSLNVASCIISISLSLFLFRLLLTSLLIMDRTELVWYLAGWLARSWGGINLFENGDCP